MSKASTGAGNFIVQIRNTQNSSWQGMVTWTDSRKTQPFRSALELIKLIDSALKEDPSMAEGSSSASESD